VTLILGDVEIGLPDPLDTLVLTVAARPADCEVAQAERLRARADRWLSDLVGRGILRCV